MSEWKLTVLVSQGVFVGKAQKKEGGKEGEKGTATRVEVEEKEVDGRKGRNERTEGMWEGGI